MKNTYVFFLALYSYEFANSIDLDLMICKNKEIDLSLMNECLKDGRHL